MKLVTCIAFFGLYMHKDQLKHSIEQPNYFTFVVFTGSASTAIFWPSKVCTILASVPYRNVPYEYYWFPTKDDKIEANRRFFASESNKGKFMVIVG